MPLVVVTDSFLLSLVIIFKNQKVLVSRKKWLRKQFQSFQDSTDKRTDTDVAIWRDCTEERDDQQRHSNDHGVNLGPKTRKAQDSLRLLRP
jgi:hypothetical protein